MYLSPKKPATYTTKLAPFYIVIHKSNVKNGEFDKIIAKSKDFNEFRAFKNPQLCNHYVSKQLTTLPPSMER